MLVINKPYRNKVKGSGLVPFLTAIKQTGVELEQLVFVCVGTDRSTGDAIGPLVGTMLEEAGYEQVIGTLFYPCDGSNIRDRVKVISEDKTVIAIDACLGQAQSVEMFQISNMPLEPGTSLGKKLPAVGDYSIAAIVNVNNGSKFHVLQTTSLRLVMHMASEIVNSIKEVFPTK